MTPWRTPGTDRGKIHNFAERPPRAHASEEDVAFTRIRANYVFQEMIIAVLTASIAAGVCLLAYRMAAMAIEGSWSVSAAASGIVGALAYALGFFIAGFAAAAALGMPLYRLLDRSEHRAHWPYALFAAGVTMLVLLLVGAPPSLEAPWRLAHFLPGLAAAILFIRKLRIVRRIAEAVEPRSGAIPTLH